MVSAAAGAPRSPSLCRDLALVHHPVLGEVRVFQMMHDQSVEILGIGEHVAHDLGVGDARLAVRKRHGAGFAQQADLAHLLAREALGHRGHWVHIDERRVARAAQDEIDKRHVVDHGIGVRHDGESGHAAGGRGAARGRERLAVLVARLAGEDHHVDEPRRHECVRRNRWAQRRQARRRRYAGRDRRLRPGRSARRLAGRGPCQDRPAAR